MSCFALPLAAKGFQFRRQLFGIARGNTAEQFIDPMLMRGRHGREGGAAAPRQGDERGAAVAITLRPRNKPFRNQPVDNAGDIAVRHNQETSYFAHQHAIWLAVERRHHVEARQGHIKLRLKLLPRHALDEAARPQQPDPQPQPRLSLHRAIVLVRRSGGRRWRHHVSPPETEIAWPVIAALSPAQSQTTAAATSSGLMKRACGLLAASALRVSEPLRFVAATMRLTARSSIGVSVKPGHTAFTVIPSVAVSAARARARPITPCLAAT